MVYDFIRDPIKKLAAAQQSLRKTDLGRGGVIRVELNPSTNAIQYVVTATGERLDSPKEAFVRASSLMMTQYESLTAVSGSVSNLINNPNNPKYAQVGEILSDVQNKLKGLDQNQLDSLKKMGIDIGATGTDVSANIITSRTQKGAKPKDFLQQIRKMSESGPTKGGFIPFIDEEGANLLQLKVGSKILSDEETYYMLSVIGNPIFNQEKFASVFDPTGKGIDAFMEKITKRMKGLISERDITITEDTLRKAFGGKKPDTVIIEEGLDVLKKHFKLGDQDTLGQKAIAKIDSETILKSSLENSIKDIIEEQKKMGKISVIQDPEKYINSFFQRSDIRNAIANAKDNKGLMAAMEQLKIDGDIGEDDLRIFKKFMDDAEKEFDGYAVLNKKIIRGKDGVVVQLNKQIEQLKNDIKNSSSPAQKEKLMQRLEQLQERKGVIDRAENIYQVTGRGSYEGRGIKTAFDIRELGAGFENVAMIIGRSGMKEEIGLAGETNFITISGFGRSSSSVYADPVSVAFHPEVFASKEELESMQQYSAQIQRDFQEAIESDVLPEKIRNMLNKNVTEDLSNVPTSMRSAKLRNQQYARRILELHQSGIGPKQSPEMMNLLHSTFAAEAFRMTTKEGQARYLPTMPNVFRFAVSTETGAALGGGEESILGRGIENINFKLAGQDTTAELLKFRISNGTLLFAPGAVPEFFESLGGFDLDDKGLPRLMTYEDASNNRRLAFSLTRQPSGIQESIFASAKLNDANTLRALFGEKEDFLQGLRSITVKGTLEETLLNSLTGTGAKAIDFKAIKEADIETVIQNVYAVMGRSIGKMDERMLQNLAQYGPSALRNTDLYSRSGIHKIFKEKGAFDFTLDKQMEDLVDKYKSGLDPNLYSEIKDALSISDDKLKRTKLTTLINNNKNSQGLDALLTHSIFKKMETAALEEGNILGVYVNRTMVVGSTLNQFDDYINLIRNNSQISDDLKKILGREIGLVSSETAIDMSVNYSSSKFMAKMSNLSELTANVIAAGGSDKAASDAALKVLGYTDEQILTGFTIDTVGKQAVKTLGERMGAATALMTSQEFGGQFDASLRPVIDQILLEDRLSFSDINDLLDSIRQGIKDARAAQTLTGSQLDQLEKELLNIPASEAERRSELSRIFGASSQHRYASMAKLNKFGEDAKAQFDLIKRINLSNIPQDHILAATTVSEEAKKVANVLLDKHSEAYQDAMAKLLDESADHEEILRGERQTRLGQKIYEDIIGAQQMTGLSKEEIINAVDKASAERQALTRQRGIDLSRLDYIDDENFLGQVTTTRARRMANAIRITAGDLEEQILNDLVNTKISGATQASQEDLPGILQKYFNDMLEASLPGSEERYLAQAALGQDIEETASEAEKEIARRRNRVIKVQTANRVLQQDQATVQALTATGQTTFTGDDNLRRAINASLNDEDYSNFINAKGKYVRFSEYIKSGELKNLFKNDNIFRSSIYAAGALIVGSFAYQHFKDHTPEKVQGPPLLPGGSAYEGQYPNRAAEIPQIGTTSYNPGVSYKVNLYGNRRQVSQFQDMAMGLGNFDMDTTMYSGIPQVGTDPYQQLASSY
jgi:hypothetical protein